MLVYIGLWAVVAICALLEILTEKKSLLYKKEKKIYFWCCLIAIWLVGVSRAELLGADVEGYREHFYRNGTLSTRQVVERGWNSDIGYYLFGNLIYRYVSESFLVYRNILYTVTLGLFAIVIYKKSSYPAMSFLIFLGLDFLGYIFCLLRQSIALALCVLSYICMDEKKYIASILLIVFASIFHLTAVFFLLMYAFVGKDRNRLKLAKNINVLLICIILAAVFIPKLIPLYKGGRYDRPYRKGQGAWRILFYIVIMIFLLRIIWMTKKEDMDSKLIRQFDASCSALYTQIGALFFSLFSRVAVYFSAVFILTVPRVLEQSKEKKFWQIGIIAAFSFMYFLFLWHDSMTIVPYSWGF